MDVVNEILKQVVTVLMAPVKEHIRCMISYRKYVENMHTKMTELDAIKAGEENHLDRNRGKRLEVPAQLGDWLAKVEEVNVKVENFSSEVLGCLDLKSRHMLGRKAFKIIEKIKSVTTQHSSIQWTDTQIPLGRIDSTMASTSILSSDRDDFPSREQTFTKALEALGPNHGSHMVALCGMPGVGKTTMIKKLKQVVIEKRMFNYYVEVVIGDKTDPIDIQNAVAEYLGITLTENKKPARTDKIRKWFVDNSDGGKNKFLLILDDVWQFVDLEDIGLSRLPNQGVDFKVLITSRNLAVCTQMGVKVDSVLEVRLLDEAEAQSLFLQSLEPFEDVDHELHKIGEDIVKKCCGLPIAIVSMARTLRRSKSKDTWKDTLSGLEHHEINQVVKKVFEMSYKNLQDEDTKSIFLLCGLFPEDFKIPTEDLVRYGWGLKLFKRKDAIREARYRLNTCIERLLDSNLLIHGDDVGFVKMHDLVRDFVLDMFSKVEHASIVNHGSMSGWPETENDVRACCKRISLTCKGMYEFPTDLKFPNLSILKLMHGDRSLKFPQGFYAGMEKLQVISYDLMKYPLLLSSFECSTNLRVLLLHKCSLAFNFFSIGNLSNLEVLSFAYSDIESLPTTIGSLEKLRVLDVSYCNNLCIDKRVFKNLVRLEELYAFSDEISFIDDNNYEVAKRWNNLSALEFEFYGDMTQWKNLSFENLELFRISVGRSSYIRFLSSTYISANTLELVTKKGEVSGSRINKLYERTEVLHLHVDDMNALGDIKVISSSFHNLRSLVVSHCAELKYLFTLGVAKSLSNLEHLEVYNCRVMKELIDLDSGGEERVTFPNLKFLSLRGLPKLSGLFKEEVLIPKLEKLCIEDMVGLKEIWPCEFRTSGEVKLKEIKVSGCDNVVNLFPCNPMSLLHHLEKLQVIRCDCVEALFNIDLDRVGEIGEEECNSSLIIINVAYLRELREVWRIKSGEDNCGLPILSFQAVERITIENCKSFRNVISPATSNFDLGALTHMDIKYSGEYGQVESSEGQEINILFPSRLIHSFRNLHNFKLVSNEVVEVIFEIESIPRSQDNQRRLFPYLEDLQIRNMERLSHVWKCKWNELLVLHKNLSESPFHNLTTIQMLKCHSIKYLFSPLMARLLSNLKKVNIKYCDGIEEVVSHRDDEDEDEYEEKTTSTSTHASTTFFPHLHSLDLFNLKNLKCIGGGNNEISFTKTTTTTSFLDLSKFSQVDGVSWTLCQYPRGIIIERCHALSSVIPCCAAGQMQKLQVLKIKSCRGMKEVFETQGINKSVVMPKLPNLKILEIVGCELLEHIFTFSTLETLRQLEKLKIERCKAMKVIVVKAEEDDEEQTTKASSSKAVVFPHLKSIELMDLPELMGFFLGTNGFQWPSLDDLVIKDCPQMKGFTAGGSEAPQLKYVEASLGKHSPGCWFNSHVTTTTTGKQDHETPFRSLESTSSSCATATTSEEINIWSFS